MPLVGVQPSLEMFHAPLEDEASVESYSATVMVAALDPRQAPAEDMSLRDDELNLALSCAPEEDDGLGASSVELGERSADLVAVLEPTKAPPEDYRQMCVLVDGVRAPAEDDELGESSLELGESSPGLVGVVEPQKAPPEHDLTRGLLFEEMRAPDEGDGLEASSVEFGESSRGFPAMAEPQTAPPEDYPQRYPLVHETGASSPMLPFRDTSGAASLLKSTLVDSPQLDRLQKLLPTGKDNDARRRRHELFMRWDPNGNGVLSLAEVDKGIEELAGSMVPKPAISRAFHAARRIAPPVVDYSDDFIDFNEFRLFSVYLCHYDQLWHWFSMMDASADRRVSFAEFRGARRLLERWGCCDAFHTAMTDAESVFKDMDRDGGGLVLFDEFAHWVLNHCGELFDAGDDEDRAEAWAMLKKQAPNTSAENEEQRLHGMPRPSVHQRLSKAGALSSNIRPGTAAGGPVVFDKDRLAGLLPSGRDALAHQRRRALFSRWDPNSNGVLSLAEVDKGIEELVGSMVSKPAIHRAFHAARRISPPVADYSDDFLDFNEFRLFNAYLRHYLELWHWFSVIDASGDRRVTLAEFRGARQLLDRWGCRAAFEAAMKDVRSVFKDMDRDGGGFVLFDEFAHWILSHCEVLFDAGDDKDRAEALALLRRRAPNTCAENEEHRLHAVPRPSLHQGVPKLPLKRPTVRPAAPGSARGRIMPHASTSARGPARSESADVDRTARQSRGSGQARSGSRPVRGGSRESSLEPRPDNPKRGGASHGARSRESSIEHHSDVSTASARASSVPVRVQNLSDLQGGKPPRQNAKSIPGSHSRGSSVERRQNADSGHSRSITPMPFAQFAAGPRPSSARPAQGEAAREARADIGRPGCIGSCNTEHQRAAARTSARSSSLPPSRPPSVTSKKAQGTGTRYAIPKIEASRSRLRQHTGCTRARMEALQKPATPKQFRPEFLGPTHGWRRS